MRVIHERGAMAGRRGSAGTHLTLSLLNLLKLKPSLVELVLLVLELASLLFECLVDADVPFSEEVVGIEQPGVAPEIIQIGRHGRASRDVAAPNGGLRGRG